MPGERKVLALLAVAAIAAACSGSPTSACSDPRATTGFNLLEVTCAPVSSDAQCTALALNDNLYACGPTQADVTATAAFTSSAPSVAAFGVPSRPTGYLTALGTGVVIVTATYPGLGVSGGNAFFFSSGQPSEQMYSLVARVQDAFTGAKVNGASVTLSQQSVAPQECVTAIAGACDVWARNGQVTVVAVAAAGYEPQQTTLVTALLNGTLIVTVNLMPSRAATTPDLSYARDAATRLGVRSDRPKAYESG